LKNICEIVRDAESNLTQGTTKLGDYVDWSMHQTIQRIDAYLNSKHITGDTDALGRPKPFFNIVSAAVNIWYRATDLDRKNIKFFPKNNGSTILAFIANVLLQNWMDKNRFGQFLNSWGRGLAKYGSAVLKFVEQDGELMPSVIPWNRMICDPVDFDSLPRIEKFYKTPAQLGQIKEYDQVAIDALITALQSRNTISGRKKDNQNNFIELYEVHGEMDSRLLDKEPDLSLENKDIKYIQQMHVISFVKSDKDGYNDYTLYKGKEARDPYMLTHLIEEDGRTLSIGAVEYLFDAQWMQNHTVKNMKDTLDLASKLIFQTSDSKFVGRNVLTAIETGDIFIHDIGAPLTRIANDKPDITAMQNFGSMWRNVAQEITSTPEALRGTTMPSGTPFALGSYLGEQASSLFEIMTENKGLALEDMIKRFIIPNLKKQLDNKDEILAILDATSIQEIDAMYIPKEAIKRFNKKTKGAILSEQTPSPFNPTQQQAGVQQDLATSGNKRFFKPDELDKQTWADLFSDFEWDNVRVEITKENTDKQAVMQTLATSLQTIASNPMVLQDPNARMLFNAILTETGRISPMQIASTPPPQPQLPAMPGGGTPAVGAGGGLPVINQK
jgi:hypothetical protein